MTGILAVIATGHQVVINVTASPSSVSGPGATDFTTATPSNGLAPFTYFWQYVSGTLGIIATNADAASTAFSGPPGVALFRCLVTDASGATGYSNNVTVNTT